MSFIRVAMACATPIALSFALVSSPVAAETSPAFERAMLAEMDAPTRAAVSKRVNKGTTVTGVIATILLNNYQASPKHPGAGLTVIAVDYARGVAVLGSDQKTFEIIKFDSKTLHLIR